MKKKKKKREMEGGNFPSRFTNANDNNNTNKKYGSNEVVASGQEQYLPVANIVRIMRKVLPANAKISDDTKETIQECVSEFISFITSEANERCQREHRKTVTAEDLIWAMGKLGFDDYIEPLTSYVNRYRRLETGRTPIQTEYSMPRNNVGVPLNVNNYGHQTQMFDLMGVEPSVNQHGRLHIAGAGPGDGYYYEDSSGSASGSGSAVGGYNSNSGMFDMDQYGQFK